MDVGPGMDIALAALASLFAGGIDAIVGGGGLILVPALFLVYPTAPAATLLGTNKVAALAGTTVSAARFSRAITLDWGALLPALLLAALGALAGAWTLSVVDTAWLRKALPLVLVALLAYTWVNKQLGVEHAPVGSMRQRRLILAAVAVTIGFYDGLFGPGTGSFFIFALVRLIGFDFLHASAYAKVLNIATNAAALFMLAQRGMVWWQVGAVLAAANIAGSVIGSALAIRWGPRFVRAVFLLVVLALIARTGYSAYFA